MTTLMEEQRQLQREYRRRGHQEDGGGHPGLHAHHVQLAVEEERPRPPLGQVRRHQADDRLIGVEVGLLVVEKDEERRTISAAVSSRAHQTTSDDEARAGVITRQGARAPVPGRAGAASRIVRIARVAPWSPRRWCSARSPARCRMMRGCPWPSAARRPLPGTRSPAGPGCSARWQVGLAAARWRRTRWPEPLRSPPSARPARRLAVLTLRAAGLGASLAALLALVSAAAPLAGWGASSPLGAAPLAAVVSATLLVLLTRQRRHGCRWAGRRDGAPRDANYPPRSRSRAADRDRRSSARGPDRCRRSRRRGAFGRGDIGLIGLVLLAARGNDRGTRDVRGRVSCWVPGRGLAPDDAVSGGGTGRGCPALGVVDSRCRRDQSARLARWQDDAVGRSGAAARGWRCSRATRPWGHERQQAALVGTWARAMAEHLTETQPLVTDRSPRGRLLSALVARRERGPSSTPAAITSDEGSPRNRGRAPACGPHRHTARHVALGRRGVRTVERRGRRAARGHPGGTAPSNQVTRWPRSPLTLRPVVAAAIASAGRVGLRLPDAGTARAPCAGRHHRRTRPVARGGAGRIRPARRAAGRRAGPHRRPARPWTRASTQNHTRVSVWLRGQLLLRAGRRAWPCSSSRAGATCSAGARVVNPAHLDGPALGPKAAAGRRRWGSGATVSPVPARRGPC